jgi:hypothetical protein
MNEITMKENKEIKKEDREEENINFFLSLIESEDFNKHLFNLFYITLLELQKTGYLYPSQSLSPLCDNKLSSPKQSDYYYVNVQKSEYWENDWVVEEERGNFMYSQLNKNKQVKENFLQSFLKKKKLNSSEEREEKLKFLKKNERKAQSEGRKVKMSGFGRKKYAQQIKLSEHNK